MWARVAEAVGVAAISRSLGNPFLFFYHKTLFLMLERAPHCGLSMNAQLAMCQLSNLLHATLEQHQNGNESAKIRAYVLFIDFNYK